MALPHEDGLDVVSLPFATEYAKSGRASCKKCKNSIGRYAIDILLTLSLLISSESAQVMARCAWPRWCDRFILMECSQTGFIMSVFGSRTKLLLSTKYKLACLLFLSKFSLMEWKYNLPINNTLDRVINLCAGRISKKF